MSVKEAHVLTIEEAGRMLGVSRWLAYEQARSGLLGGVPVIKIGRRLVVPRKALEAVLRGESLPLQPQSTGSSNLGEQ